MCERERERERERENKHLRYPVRDQRGQDTYQYVSSRLNYGFIEICWDLKIF